MTEQNQICTVHVISEALYCAATSDKNCFTAVSKVVFTAKVSRSAQSAAAAAGSQAATATAHWRAGCSGAGCQDNDCLPSVRSPLFRGCAAKNWEKRLTFLTNANTVLYAVRTESMSCTCLIVTQQFAGGNIKCQAKLNLVFLPLSTTRQGQPAVRKLPMQHITIYLMSYHVKWINFYQIKLICCI